MRKIALLLLAIFVLAIGTVLSGLVSFNAGFLRGPIETAVYEATGLPLTIGERMVIRLGPRPEITGGGIVFGAPSVNPLLTVDSLYARVDLSAFLRGNIHVHELTADGILVDYCSSMPVLDGDSDVDVPPSSVAVDAIQFEQISIGCGPPSQEDPLRIDVEQATASAPVDTPSQLQATGSVSAIDFALTASGGELDQLLANPEFDARLALMASDMQSFSELFDLNLPAVGELNVEGRVLGNLDTIELIDFSGNLGASQFAFDATVDIGGERPHVGLTAALQQLDLAPFVDDGVATEQPTQVAESGDIDFGTAIDMLDNVDADLLITASRILGVPLDPGAVEIKATITSGNVELHSLTANVSGGEISMSGGFESGSECPEINLVVRGGDFSLAALHERLGGHVDTASLDVSSCGRTIFTHRDSLRAKAALLGGRLILDGDPFPLDAKRIDLSVEPGGRTGARLTGELADEAVDATLTAGSLRALLNPGTWPIELEARAAGSRFLLNGQAGLVAGQPVLNATVKFEAPRIGSLHRWTSGAPGAELPLRMTSRLHFGETSLDANAIALSLGQSDLGGDLAWSHAADPDTLAINLHSSFLDLSEINTIFSKESGPSEQTGAAVTLLPIDLDLKIDAIRSDRLDLQQLSINGRMRKGFIDDANISVLVEDEVRLRGELDLDLRQSPARASTNVAAENVDIGLVMARLEVADDLQLRADRLELLATTEGTTPAELLENTRLEARILNFFWNISGFSEEAFDLSLEQLSLTTTPNQPSTWSSSGQVDGTSVELWMETPSLAETFGGTAELPLTLVAAADADVVMLEARVNRSTEDRLAAHFLLSGEVLESENRSLAQLTSPLADYEIGSTIQLTDDALELPDIQMRIGSSEATGSLKAAKHIERRRVDIALHAPTLQTDDLLYWSRDASETSTDDETADRGVIHVARDFIAEFRESNDLDVNITVDELRAGTSLLGGSEIHLFVDEHDFLLKPLTISLPGGGVNAEYTASIRDGRLDAGLKVNADALVYGGLLRLADPESDARGVLYLDVDIGANTEWSPGAVPFNLLFQNADGSVSIAAWPENIEAGVLDLWTANLVLALLPRADDGEVSKLNCIATQFDIEKGVMKSRGPLLDSTDTIIRGRGTIDFAKEELDLLVWPQAKREKFLSASTPVSVTGTFDDFQIGVAPAGFVGTMIKMYTSLIYVPFKWITGERFPPDGTATCFDAMGWELTPELNDYFQRRDYSAPPTVP